MCRMRQSFFLCFTRTPSPLKAVCHERVHSTRLSSIFTCLRFAVDTRRIPVPRRCRTPYSIILSACCKLEPARRPFVHRKSLELCRRVSFKVWTCRSGGTPCPIFECAYGLCVSKGSWRYCRRAKSSMKMSAWPKSEDRYESGSRSQRETSIENKHSDTWRSRHRVEESS